jgi:hypothetical protein
VTSATCPVNVKDACFFIYCFPVLWFYGMLPVTHLPDLPAKKRMYDGV